MGEAKMTGILGLGVTRLKICLVGERGVGKTSLIRRFVENTFDEAYVRTIGTMVLKRDVDVPEVDRRVRFLVWDVMGHKEFADIFKEIYTKNLAGVVGVFDVTRPETLKSLDCWVNDISDTIGDVPVLVLANKKDLRELVNTSEKEIMEFCSQHSWEWLATSAKTGENVQDAFYQLATNIIQGKNSDAYGGGSSKDMRNPQRDTNPTERSKQTPPLVLMSWRQVGGRWKR